MAPEKAPEPQVTSGAAGKSARNAWGLRGRDRDKERRFVNHYRMGSTRRLHLFGQKRHLPGGFGPTEKSASA